LLLRGSVHRGRDRTRSPQRPRAHGQSDQSHGLAGARTRRYLSRFCAISPATTPGCADPNYL